MKIVLKTFVFLFFIFSFNTTFAQNVGISAASGFTPDASAGLDISYTNKGLLVPRVVLTATNAAGPITSPATSLLVYNTATAGTYPNNVVPGYYYWNGTAWTPMVNAAQTAGSAWTLNGNAGTTAGTNFLGTTDAVDFMVKTNNTERMRISSIGDVAIGGTAFNGTNPEQLLVDAGTTPSINVISGKGNINSYLQLNIQNFNAGTAASSDVVATADNGTETVNYVDMGINSSANTAALFGGINDSYLFSVGGTATGGNLFIGTSTAGKSLGFLTGGGATTNERMRIDGTGNVGIGTANPTAILHLNGTNPLKINSVALGTSTTADSLLTITNSLVRKIPMTTFASPTNSWSTTGNAGTTAGTNFIGTTDANDMVFKANNVERIRIVNGTSAATGTTGDVTIGDATSGTLRSNKELVLRQDGDTFGQTTLRLRNRSGQNGAVFETTGASSVNLVDFIFNTGPVATPVTSNIRFETRAANQKVTGNTTEWQIGQPDATNGGPTLIIGASGTGSNSALRTGNFGVGLTSPTATLHLRAGTATASSAPLKFTSGTLLTTGEVGAHEFLTDIFYGTITTGAARKEFTLNDAPLTVGKVPVVTTNGRLTSNANFTYDNTNSRLGLLAATPTAYLHLGAGTATASTAPLKFTTGANLTTPEAGAVEFDGTNYYATSAAIRYTLAKTLMVTTTITFPAAAANSSSSTTVTVTGAALGDVVALGLPTAAVIANSLYTAYVSAANTVTISLINNSAATVTPASGTFRVSVLKY